MSNGELILYTSEDGKTSIQLKAQEETVWLTRTEIAELSQITPQNVTLHIKEIYATQEVEIGSTSKDYLLVQNEGGRHIRRTVKMYLDYAELQAKRRKTITMREWEEKLDTFLSFNEKDLLNHAGKISAQVAEKLSLERYSEFNQKRREEEKLLADAEDITYLEQFISGKST